VAENEERSREDLTEEESPYRLEEFRRKGQVAQSREISALLALLGVGCAAYIMAPQMGAQIFEFMREVFRVDIASHADLGTGSMLSEVLTKALKIGALVALPVCLAGFVLGALGSFAQIGSIFSTDPLNFDINKINPLEGAKRFFTMRHVLDSLRIIFKMVIILAVAYGVAKSEVFRSPGYITEENASLLGAFGRSSKAMFFSLVGVMVIFSIFDFAIQKWDFSTKLRMTKAEQKQEFKEREGDPLIKSRIRAIQRDVARKRMMTAVKTADVIVTNPTHIAIALKYDKENMLAPKVVAKGADFIAQKIKKLAADAGVPMVENVPLARTLFKSVKVNQYIPRALYQAVAEVLAYVYRLKNRTF
jgi:flagellar biosynthetic protein FlhB